MTICTCGLEKNYAECCGRFINGQQLPATPEELMRSRYTAYTQANMDYIRRTMLAPAANNFDLTSTQEWAKNVEWLKLEVISTAMGNNKGFVEFIAYFNLDKKKQSLHEISEFHFENGQWYYVDGKAPKTAATTPITVTRIGRNEPCLCGSGKKYKKCCGING